MTTGFVSRILAALMAIPMLWVGAALAQDRATPEEAQSMAERAAALFLSDGAEAAFAAYVDNPEFHDRDLYVFAFGTEGLVMSHGQSPALIGRNVMDLRDPSGRQFIREFLQVEDTGWVDYQWRNPETGVVENKTSYVINVGDYVVGVGAYIP